MFKYKFFHAIAAGPLIAVAMASASHAQTTQSFSGPQLLPEFRPIGGVNNNLQLPHLNAIPGNAELAIAPLHFARGTQNGLINGPNPRVISNVISGGTGANGVNAETTDPSASAWLYVFGQFVDHDLDLETTPTTNAAINITVPPNDPVFSSGTTIAVTRDTRNPTTNTIVNTVAGYLDLSQLYGSTDAQATSLRNPDGTLASSGGGTYLPVSGGAFITGDPRVMENPELSAVTTLFMREHNFWVHRLATQRPQWTPDQLYHMARAITTAEYQNIIYREYLPVLIGPVIGAYRGYNPRVNPQVTQEFSAAAFRVGHTQVSDTQEGLDNNGQVTFTESLAQAFFNKAADDEANGFDALIRSFGADFSQATDVYAVGVLRNLLFAPLVGGDIDQIDLIAIDIQRERDVGLASLNATREALGLRPYGSFAQLTGDTVLQSNLESMYGNIGNVDLFMGGLAERHAWGANVGPTFQAIIARQFEALRDGDRFFWQNQRFDRATAATIASTTLATLVLRNTDSTLAQAAEFLAAPAGHVKNAVVAPAPVGNRTNEGGG